MFDPNVLRLFEPEFIIIQEVLCAALNTVCFIKVAVLTVVHGRVECEDDTVG